MLELYRNSPKLPEIKVAPNSFLVVLPKMSLKKEYVEIIDYLKEKDYATREEIEKILGMKKVATLSVLNEMLDRNIILKQGNSRDIIYKLR